MTHSYRISLKSIRPYSSVTLERFLYIVFIFTPMRRAYFDVDVVLVIIVVVDVDSQHELYVLEIFKRCRLTREVRSIIADHTPPNY